MLDGCFLLVKGREFGDCDVRTVVESFGRVGVYRKSVVVHYKGRLLSDFGYAPINYSRWSQRWILRIRFWPSIDLVLAAHQTLPGLDID